MLIKRSKDTSIQVLDDLNLYFSVVCLNFSLSSEMTKIQLNVISSCADDVELGWMIFTPDDELLSLSNCSLTVSEHLEKPAVDHWFPILHRQGTYKLGDKLFDGLRYSFQMKCGRIGSNSVLLTALGKHSFSR